MTETGFFLIVTGLATVSVSLTFVLFRFLRSQAEGKGKFLGGTIRYGGSLAGFLLIFGTLFGAFYRLKSDPGVTTPINIGGEWSLDLHMSTSTKLKGSVTIRQRQGDPVITMSGEILGAGAITFDSMVGMIHDRDIYLVYENLKGERGVIRGKAMTDDPATLSLVYTDLAGSDLNNDPTGTLHLKRAR